MSTRIFFAIAILLPSIGACDLLTYEIVNSEDWVSECARARTNLEASGSSYLEYAGEIDLALLGEFRWQVNGLDVSLPYSVAGPSTIMTSEAGARITLVQNPENALTIVLEERTSDTNYWIGEETLQKSREIFGDSVNFDALLIESLARTPSDVQCDTRTLNQDARLIAMLDYKRALFSPSMKIYQVQDGDWRGLSYCTDTGDGAVIDFSVVSQTRTMKGSIAHEGECNFEFE